LIAAMVRLIDPKAMGIMELQIKMAVRIDSNQLKLFYYSTCSSRSQPKELA
jgi:hypothetical protein